MKKCLFVIFHLEANVTKTQVDRGHLRGVLTDDLDLDIERF